MSFRPAIALAALATVAALPAAHAVTITQWTFNSVVADANTGTGTVQPSTGSGAATTVGGTTFTFASGDANGGSSDPATGDDSGWNITAFAAQGTGDKARGVQYAVSTVGFEDIVISYDIRHSNTASSFEQVQYSLDGSNFIDIATFSSVAGDTWSNGRSVDLSAIAGADNNASFAFRVVSTFAPGTTVYAATTPGSTYATTGTWRFDVTSVSGVTPIPEPGTTALLLAGLAAVGYIARRRA